MANVVPIGEPVNDAERRAIAWLRDHLPNGYTLFHNFEIQRHGERFEVDLAVLAPHAVYLVDVKGTRGLIDVYGPKWYPEGRQPFTSPLLKLRGHARSLKGIITASHPGRRDLQGVYVDAVIVLSAPDAHFVDQGGRDSGSVTRLKDAAGFFQNTGRIPGRFDRNIGRAQKMVIKAIQGAARRPTGPEVLGDWRIVERLGETDSSTEYRAVNNLVGERGGTVLLKVYRADPYETEANKKKEELARISNAFHALNRLPGHPCIVGARTFFPTEGDREFVLVTDDVAGQALRLHIDKPTLALTLDQKLRIARELLAGLAHCHVHDVVHRNLTPATILLGSDGHLRLTGFDFARVGRDRSQTIARQIVDEIDPAYTAPEAYREPEVASAASDVFSVGLVLYELFAGEPAFGSPTELFDQSAVFSTLPSSQRAEVSPTLDAWLQRLCTFDPDERPSAREAAEALDLALAASAAEPAVTPERPPRSATDEPPAGAPMDWGNLPRGTLLAGKLEVQERLGGGAFGVVYKAVDTLGDVTRAIKLILRDRHSTLERLKKEYKTLLHLPPHPHVVRVIDANVLPGEDGPPYLLFEYVEGEDLGDLIEDGRFAPEDALVLFQQAAQGLVHLHREGVRHCDIKPHNLLWTVQGAKIIDFNVAVRTEDEGHGGGSRRYLPPDLDLRTPPTPGELADRDVYALGLSAYEALTGGRYPWDTAAPPPAAAAPDPRHRSAPSDLAPDLVEVVLKAVAPRRGERFADAAALLEALEGVPRARREVTDDGSGPTLAPEFAGADLPPNTNPFVSYLLTLYSQSPRTNAGTRGLDDLGRATYVPTLLDDELLPAVLDGRFTLVVITGNAGDGKTAFLQQLESQAQTALLAELPNGRRFAARGRTFLTNYDGSQDEGDRTNDEVLGSFFAPYEGEDPDAWPTAETRLIAINEGRLVDFLTHNADRFPALRRVVLDGLESGAEASGVAVVNLNLRSVVADPRGLQMSLLERQLRLLTAPKFWSACQTCDLKDRCYALHNARSFQDRTAGPQVLDRLKTLYTLTHLRGRLHITLRDLRSSLAYTLTSARDCDQIHALYRDGKRERIADGFYFNAWMGGTEPTADRLLGLLKGVDIGEAADPRLDRGFDFVSPAQDRSRFGFGDRGTYDHEVLRASYEHLPRDFSGRPSAHRVEGHRRYVAMARRRAFFERRDGRWRTLLPYRSAARMLSLVEGETPVEQALQAVLQAVNRAEGLLEPASLAGSLALRVRRVEDGTIQSYRLFDAARFRLAVRDAAARARFVEHMPDALLLSFEGGEDGGDAELVLDLDIFEMLERLNQGYRPSLEEEQGYYLSLAVFKNVLGSAPYQEVLLTTTGHDFYRVERHADGRLSMNQLSGGMR